MARKKATIALADLDVRQSEFIRLYLDPKSETFGNAYRSAVKAGYSDDYAQVITTRAGRIMSEIEIRRTKLLEKAERNLEEFVDLETMQDAMGPFGPIINKKTGEAYKRFSTGIASLKLQATTFVAETIGKANYSKRTNFIMPIAPEMTPEQKEEILAIYRENAPKQLTTPQSE